MYPTSPVYNFNPNSHIVNKPNENKKAPIYLISQDKYTIPPTPIKIPLAIDLNNLFILSPKKIIRLIVNSIHLILYFIHKIKSTYNYNEKFKKIFKKVLIF